MVPCTEPRSVTSVTRRNSSGVICHTGENTVTMALLIQMSIKPQRVAIASAAAGTFCASATSADTAMAAFAPWSSASSLTRRSASSSRAIRPRGAPERANLSATARPNTGRCTGNHHAYVSTLLRRTEHTEAIFHGRSFTRSTNGRLVPFRSGGCHLRWTVRYPVETFAKVAVGTQKRVAS